MKVRYEGIQTGAPRSFPLYTVLEKGEYEGSTLSDRTLREKFNVRVPGKGLAQAFHKKGDILNLEVLS